MSYQNPTPTFDEWYTKTTGKLPWDGHCYCDVRHVYGADCGHLLKWEDIGEEYEAAWGEPTAHLQSQVDAIGYSWTDANDHMKRYNDFLKYGFSQDDIPF